MPDERDGALTNPVRVGERVVPLLVPARRSCGHTAAVPAGQRLDETLGHLAGEYVEGCIQPSTPQVTVVDIPVPVTIAVWKVSFVQLPGYVLARQLGMHHLGELRTEGIADDDNLLCLQLPRDALHRLRILEECGVHVPLEGRFAFGKLFEGIADALVKLNNLRRLPLLGLGTKAARRRGLLQEQRWAAKSELRPRCVARSSRVQGGR